MEDEVIADIARRVQKTGRYTETAELMAKSMVEQGYSADKIQADVMKFMRADKELQMAIAENTKAHKQEIQDIINETVKKAKADGDKLVAEAGNMAWNNDLSMWQEQGVDLKKPNTMSQLIASFQAQTARELRNLTRSTGFRNTLLGTTGVMNAYQREMDLALLKVASGTFSYDVAVNECVHRLAQSGLRTIDYASGKTYQIDTAVRMSVRTGMSQLAGKIMEENLKSTGQDLVITSQHIGSRPEHVPWQNKVFSYSGKSKKYPDFVSGTGYGSAAGLKGVNCTHDFYPFFEGSSVIPDDIEEPAPVTVNGKKYTYYQATQKQRQMERSIRATKREIEAQKAIGGNTDDLLASLRRQRGEYYKFSVDVNIRPKDNRLRVIGGTSDLKKNGQEGIRNTAKKTNNTIESANKTASNAIIKQYNHRVDDLGLNYVPYKELDESTKKQIGADFTGMDVRLANATAKQFSKLSSEYETMCTGISVGKLDAVSAPAGTVSSMNVQDAKITFNKSVVKDYDKFMERMKTAVDRGQFPKIPESQYENYVITHEFTHTLFETEGSLKNYVNADTKNIEKARKEIKFLRNEYQERVRKLSAEFKDLEQKSLETFDPDIWDKAVKVEKELKDLTISNYARENADEFMAEAFAEAKLSKDPSPYSIKVLEVIDKYFKKTSLENTGASGTMKINLQFFAEDLSKQNSQSLSKGIKSLNKRIKEHEDKVANPHAYMKNWDKACEQEKIGTVDAWRREIERYKKQVNDRIDELKKRGDYNE